MRSLATLLTGKEKVKQEREKMEGNASVSNSCIWHHSEEKSQRLHKLN